MGHGGVDVTNYAIVKEYRNGKPKEHIRYIIKNREICKQSSFKGWQHIYRIGKKITITRNRLF